jgi:hypothetical protein
MATVLASAITLVGTLAVCGLGFWQWQRQQRAQRNADYREKRVAALAAVWDAVNEIEGEQREKLLLGSPVDEAHVRKHLRTINLLIMRNTPFLRADEQEWATRIVSQILQIDAALRVSSGLAKEEADWWLNTLSQPHEEIAASQAAADLRETRLLLGRRYAEVAKGDSIEVAKGDWI